MLIDTGTAAVTPVSAERCSMCRMLGPPEDELWAPSQQRSPIENLILTIMASVGVPIPYHLYRSIRSSKHLRRKPNKRTDRNIVLFQRRLCNEVIGLRYGTSRY